MQNKPSINPLSNLEFIQEVVIPKYPIRMMTSKKRRKRYFKKKYSDTKGEEIWKPRPLSKTYQAKLRKEIYTLSKNNYLLDENNERIVANSRSHGTPKYTGYSGNDFTSGNYHPNLRNQLAINLKDFYRPYVQSLTPMMGDTPIRVMFIIKTPLDHKTQDSSNLWFYYKYFEDCLFEKTHPVSGKKLKTIIPDDSYEYVSQAGSGPLFVPIKDFKEREFIFQFYKDTRDEYPNAV